MVEAAAGQQEEVPRQESIFRPTVDSSNTCEEQN
jgi:hypothetical protein